MPTVTPADALTLTCTEGGMVNWRCVKCGIWYNESVPALGHAWNEGEILPDEHFPGGKKLHFWCWRCGATKDEALPLDETDDYGWDPPEEPELVVTELLAPAPEAARNDEATAPAEPDEPVGVDAPGDPSEEITEPDDTAVAAEPSVSFYYGMGATRTATAAQTLTAATATEATFTNTTSANWSVDGPVTVVLLNHNANVLNFTPEVTYLCPAVITDTDPVEQTINTGVYTWTTPENHEYTYGPLKGTTLDEQVAALVGTYHDTVLNVGDCDSIYRHLNLTLYPTYEVTLTVYDDCGCETVFTKEVYVNPVKLKIPNVFTPNGDGKNDEFRVAYRSLKEFHCWVYNRWGHLVYEWSDPAKGWDGTINGRPAAEGAYFYVIRALGTDAPKNAEYIGLKAAYTKKILNADESVIGVYQLSGDINLLRGKKK